MAVITAQAGDLSKALSNAEGWLPAKSSVPVARFMAGPNALEITVTDTYSAGWAICPVESFTGRPAVVEISRKDLSALAARARKDGTRKTLVQVTVETGRGVIVHGSTEDHNPETATALAVGGKPNPAWEPLEELFRMAEKNETRLPAILMINPGYLALFNKVRPDIQGRGVDLYIGPDGFPILGKIGANFKGLIMPMDRERNAEAFDQEGLW